MIRHPSISVLVMIDSADATLSALLSYLKSMPHIRRSAHSHLPPNLSAEDSVKVVAILEAASRSMSNGGKLEVVHGGS